MCWSPTADLVAGCAITAVGALCVASTRRARDLPLAVLPVLLGVHQVIESVVWRNADNAADAGGTQAIGGIAVLLWVLIAFPVLPALVPLSVLSAASHWSRFRIAPFALVGLATSAALGYAMAAGPLTAEPVGHTMRYGVRPAPLGTLIVIGYLIATIGSLLVSDQPEIRLLGVVVGVGALVCYALWQGAFVSTWCALAAAVRAQILHRQRRPRKHTPAPDPLRRSRIPAR